MAEVCLSIFTFVALQTCLIGFPPADHTVRDFLTADNQRISHHEAVARVRHFLVTLFTNTADVLARKSMGSTKTDRITNFRAFMSKDQSMKSTGEGRRQFYEKVTDNCKVVRCGFFGSFRAY